MYEQGFNFFGSDTRTYSASDGGARYCRFRISLAAGRDLSLGVVYPGACGRYNPSADCGNCRIGCVP